MRTIHRQAPSGAQPGAARCAGRRDVRTGLGGHDELARLGADVDDRDHVFEPFFQGAGDGSRSDGGAGLGLAISRAIIEAHGGRMWLADAERGTCVRFRLPSVV